MIINLTQHSASPDQLRVGVVDCTDPALRTHLTFATRPTMSLVVDAANALTEIAVQSGYTRAMIGGAPFLMAPLEAALIAAGIQPLYAFSVRESVDVVGVDGVVVKTSEFRHSGWVEVAHG